MKLDLRFPIQKSVYLAIIVSISVIFMFFLLPERIENQRPVVLHDDNLKYLSFRLSSHSRLGNHLFELSTLIAVARYLNRTGVFYLENDLAREMLRKTNETSPGIIQQLMVVDGAVPPTSRNVSFNPRCCVFEDPQILSNFNDQHLHVHGFYYQSYKYFPEMRDELISYLGQRNIENLPKSNVNTHVTCIHIRRGDFNTYKQAPSDADFVKKGIKYIEKTIQTNKKREIVIFGDDVEFMKSLHNGSHISENSPSEDLTYARDNCDLVFISAPKSTFGWWMGYFSKGNQVFYTDIKMTNDKTYKLGLLLEMDYYLPHWKALRLTDDKETVIEA